MDFETYELFSRQIPFLGEKKQDMLAKAKVAVVGAGGLGSRVSEMLVRAGIGHVIIIDRDLVEESNLPRTALYDRRDIGKAKAFVACGKLACINPRGRVESSVETLHAYNAEKLLGGFDVVVDCTDNMESRYAINKFCVKQGIPWIYGATIRDEGLSASFAAGGRPCFACLYPEKPRETEKTAEAGVISPVIGIIASLQAMEAIKIITQISGPSYGRLFSVKLKRPGFELLAIKKREGCQVCGKDVLFRKK